MKAPILRIIIISFLVLNFALVKADDSGEINFALQSYIEDYNQAKTIELKSYLLSRIIAESGITDIGISEAYLKKFKKLITNSDLPIAKIRYYKAKGVINYYKKMELDSILIWYDKAAEEIKIHNIDNVKMQIALHNNRAIAYAAEERGDLAIAEYLAGLEKIGNSNEKLYAEETLLMTNIASHLQHNSQFEEALIYIEKALKANEKYEIYLNNKSSNKKQKNPSHSEYYEYVLYYQAKILEDLGRLEESEKPLLEIMAYENKPNPDNIFAKILLATLNTKKGKKGRKEIARKLITEAIMESKSLNAGIDSEVYAHFALAQLELEEGNPTSSISNLDHIFALYENTGQEISEPDIFETMALALEKSGRYKESLTYAKQFQVLKSKEKIRESKFKRGVFKNTLENIEKKYQINELEIKEKLQESKISVLIVAFLLSIITIFFIYMMYKKKEEHNKALLEINEEILLANENVLAASKAKENFLSTMSHEMRTPMNAVIGITNIMLDENPTEKQAENLKNLKFSSEALLNIIDEVLDFSSLSTNKVEIKLKPTNLQAYLDKTINSFIHAQKNTEVRIYQDQKLQELKKKIMLDEFRFSQILTNLIGNATKFTNQGHIVLRTNIIESNQKMVKIKFEIEDSGIGIPKDKLEAIFDSFAQVNNEINRTHEGTGLGLTITKRLIELKGGKIEVVSKEGEGTTFSFTLEFDKAEAITQTPIPRKAENKIFQSGIEGKKILLVEDNKLNQLVAKKVLKKFKVETSLAENGQEALEMVQKERFDLILMDIHMPIMDGLEATRKIRALDDPYFQNIPIVALSADAYSDKVQATAESGMNDYQAKPFKPEDLFQKIKTNLEAASRRRGNM